MWILDLTTRSRAGRECGPLARSSIIRAPSLPGLPSPLVADGHAPAHPEYPRCRLSLQGRLEQVGHLRRPLEHPIWTGAPLAQDSLKATSGTVITTFPPPAWRPWPGESRITGNTDLILLSKSSSAKLHPGNRAPKGLSLHLAVATCADRRRPGGLEIASVLANEIGGDPLW